MPAQMQTKSSSTATPKHVDHVDELCWGESEWGSVGKRVRIDVDSGQVVLWMRIRSSSLGFILDILIWSRLAVIFFWSLGILDWE